MSKLISKARSGVTLVELLVVILIVTILSVSMLPLLQPFVTESQYAAEAIPVISNLRTKIGVYQYDKGHVPYVFGSEVEPTQGVATWMPANGDVTQDIYSNAVFQITESASDAVEAYSGHVGTLIDVDYQDLKGKRSKPMHYQYFVIATNVTAYAVGCFGNGSGLKAGTGYAVCELNFPAAQRKLIGTWKRYKSKSAEENVQISFDTTDEDNGLRCFVPTASEIEDDCNQAGAGVAGGAIDDLISKMEGYGWEF